MNIGYIGLGLMGGPCAANLMKAGHSLHIWARRPEAVAALGAKGAILHASPAEVGKAVDILFTNVSDTPDVEQILLGENGVHACGKSGLIVVDMSTISATATRRMGQELATKGITLVDAPVSGGTVGAQNAGLTFMVGAGPEVFERIKPVLQAMGKTITRIGPCGAGQVAKSCNQIVVTGFIAVVAEALRFARENGVDPAPVREALLGGFAGSKILEIHGKRMIDGDYAPGFKTALHVKDMGIVEGIAKELDLNLPCTTLCTGFLRQTLAAGFAEEDSSAMAEIINNF